MNLWVQHDRPGMLWCGPAALSAALGVKTSEAYQMIRRQSLRRFIKAVTYSEMAHALTGFGVKFKRHQYPRDPKGCPTLKQWLEGTYRNWDETFIICITGHWIVIRNDQWACSMNQYGRTLDECLYLRTRVRCVLAFQGVSGS